MYPQTGYFQAFPNWWKYSITFVYKRERGSEKNSSYTLWECYSSVVAPLISTSAQLIVLKSSIHQYLFTLCELSKVTFSFNAVISLSELCSSSFPYSLFLSLSLFLMSSIALQQNLLFSHILNFHLREKREILGEKFQNMYLSLLLKAYCSVTLDFWHSF